MTTKAIGGMTPFEAAFGKKPHLRGVCEWGEQVYIQIEGGTKLGGQVREGRWLGMDDKSKGACIYWSDSKTVTVEQNISYDSLSAHRFEEEIETVAINKTTADSPDIVTPNINVKSPITNIEDSNIESTK